MKYAVLLLSLLLNAAMASAETGADQNPTTYQPLAAHYRETRIVAGKKQSADWYFIRQERRIEMARAGYAEVWRRDERGELTWQRVFPSDRKLIEYTPGQLRTENRLPDWRTLNTIINVQRLAELKPAGQATVFNRPARRFRGQWGNERIEVLWLQREAIPARITRTENRKTYTLDLSSLHIQPAPSWPRADVDTIDTYELLDAADLGDREHDPFVARLLESDSQESAGVAHRH